MSWWSSIVWRTTDLTRWGFSNSAGTFLPAAKVDDNFWILVSQIQSMLDHPVTGVGIEQFIISTDGSGMFTVQLTDGSIIGPYQLPLIKWNFRGAWQPLTSYAAFDVVNALNNVYQITQPFVSAATFDPTATDGHGNDLYLLILANPLVAPVVTVTSATLTLDITQSNSYLRFTSPGGCVVSIPANTDVAFPIGTEIAMRDAGESGAVSVEGLSPVVINGVTGYLNMTACVGATISIKKVDTDTWDIWGLLAG